MVSTACGRCPATWTGKRIEHCTVCHETFTGTAAGDRHRVGSHWPDERRCLTPEEMRAKGMRQNDRGQWGLGGVSPWAQTPESAATSSPESPDGPIEVSADHPQPGTLAYAQMVADRFGDLDDVTEEETR